MGLMYVPMPVGGSCQLQSQIQNLFIEAMEFAAPAVQAEQTKRLIGWRTADYTEETSDPEMAKNWAAVVGVLPVFEGDINTRLQAEPLSVDTLANVLRNAPVAPSDNQGKKRVKCISQQLSGNTEQVSQPTLPEHSPCADAPDHIWLQTAGEWPASGEFSELTWSCDNQHPDDTLYVRADLVGNSSGYLQGYKDGCEWSALMAEANHPQTGDWLYDDPIELAKAIRKGPDMLPSAPKQEAE